MILIKTENIEVLYNKNYIKKIELEKDSIEIFTKDDKSYLYFYDTKKEAQKAFYNILEQW